MPHCIDSAKCKQIHVSDTQLTLHIDAALIECANCLNGDRYLSDSEALI